MQFEIKVSGRQEATCTLRKGIFSQQACVRTACLLEEGLFGSPYLDHVDGPSCSSHFTFWCCIIIHPAERNELERNAIINQEIKYLHKRGGNDAEY